LENASEQEKILAEGGISVVPLFVCVADEGRKVANRLPIYHLDRCKLSNREISF
jgi:hypothetical protein